MIVFTSSSIGAKRSTGLIRRFPVKRNKSGAVRGYFSYLSFDIPLLFRLLFRKSADIYVSEGPPTTGVVTKIVASLKRKHFVFYAADLMSAAAQGTGVTGPVVSFLKVLEKFCFTGKRTSVLASTSEITAAIQQVAFQKAKVHEVGTGIDTAIFKPEGESVEETGHPYFIYAGTASEVHGAVLFAEVFEKISIQYPDWKLYMFVQGTEEDQLHKIAARCASLEIRSLLSPEEIARWYRGAAFGLASVKPGAGYDFAFATKALAMLATGLPVIYAGVGPIGEVIQQNNFGKSVAWQAAALKDAFAKAMTEPRLGLDERAIMAKWTESNFSQRAVAQKSVLAIEDWVQNTP
ncbi:MAG: glycosyltransferase [Microbacteriaceae bacterium]